MFTVTGVFTYVIQDAPTGFWTPERFANQQKLDQNVKFHQKHCAVVLKNFTEKTEGRKRSVK